MPRTKRTTTAKPDPAQAITDEIIALLEAGTVPWSQPWRSIGQPLRHCGTGYRGINAFLLGLEAGLKGYESPYWMTFRQAKDLGGSVRKGERSSLVVYYGTARAKGAAAEGGAGASGSAEGSADGDGEGRGAYRFLRSYRVFNAAQVEGLDARFHPAPDPDGGPAPSPIPRWQAFFEAAGRGADVPTILGGDRACYVPALDQIHLPPIERFRAASLFYSVWHHELTHATKAKHRLDRSFGVSRFGNDAYAREEMVACLSQVLMDQRMGFGTEHIDDHAAYIGAWLKVLRGDKRFLFTAAAHAQRAVDWIVEAAARGGVALDGDGGVGETPTPDAIGAREVHHEAA